MRRDPLALLAYAVVFIVLLVLLFRVVLPLIGA
jgi:hypothetical protein